MNLMVLGSPVRRLPLCIYTCISFSRLGRGLGTPNLAWNMRRWDCQVPRTSEKGNIVPGERTEGPRV